MMMNESKLSAAAAAVVAMRNTTAALAPRVMPYTVTKRFPVVSTTSVSISGSDNAPLPLKVVLAHPLASNRPDSSSWLRTDAAFANPTTRAVIVNENDFVAFIKSMSTDSAEKNVLLDADLAFDAIRAQNASLESARKAVQKKKSAMAEAEIKENGKSKKGRKPKVIVLDDDDDAEVKHEEKELKEVKMKYGDLNTYHRQMLSIPNLFEGVCA